VVFEKRYTNTSVKIIPTSLSKETFLVANAKILTLLGFLAETESF
jgi:hypothetical protein